jgi:SAM-dependent methyltransferase
MDTADRDAAEVARSAVEAREITLVPCQVERYLNPPADTRYALEFAFHLLGDVSGKTVLDLGCGTGETLVPLLRRGANASGIDISPDLIALATQRLVNEGLPASVRVGSAYETGLPAKSIDVIFAMAILHHLDLVRVREEFKRILRDDGFVIVKEPIRYSALLRQARKLFPDRSDISEYEHPLTIEETHTFCEGFRIVASRYFRLPFVPLAEHSVPSTVSSLLLADRWLLRNFSWLGRFAGVRVMKLQKA